MPRKSVASDLPSVADVESPAMTSTEASVVAALDETDSVLSALRSEARSRLVAIDNLVISIAKRDSVPSPEELGILQAAGIEREQLRRELGRARRIIEASKVAGDYAHRKSLADAVVAAESRLAERGEEIRQTIAELQAELAGLQAEVRNAIDAVEASEKAVDELKAAAPSWIQTEAAALRKAAKEVAAERRSFVRSRVQELQTLVELDSNHDSVIRYCQRFGKGHELYPHRDQVRRERDRVSTVRLTKVPEIAWNRHRDELRRELAELLPERDRLESELSERLVDVDAKLSYYVR